MRQKYDGSPYRIMLQRAERSILEHALREAGGDAGVAAELLRIDRSFLYRRMRVLEIPAPRRARGSS